jgi:hypothetical protein
MQKDILFFSNLCDFCREILSLLTKHGLKDHFMMVCVDNKSLKLPPFVDRVPLIYTTQKKLYADENLVDYVKSKFVENSLQPYALVGGNTGSYSESFSFIEDSHYDGIEDSSRNYNLLGIDQTIYTPDGEDSNGSSANGGGRRGDNKVLDKYMADRDADIQKIFGGQQQRMF